MWCCPFGSIATEGDFELEPQDQSNDEIDKQLQTSSRHRHKDVKMILVGPGESGKSTFAKQMRIIHKNGFTSEELMTQRPEVFMNVVETMQQVLQAAELLGIEFSEEDSMAPTYAGDVMEFDASSFDKDSEFPANLYEAISHLWVNSRLDSLYERIRTTSYVLDRAPYLFDSLDRIAAPGYCPTETDYLHIRTKTTGVTECYFRSGILNIRLLDVGGQRSERKKWVHCFEDVTVIIFCAAISEYDQFLTEDSRQNRLLETFQLFENICNSNWFRQCSMVLFLNKKDIFEQKLQTSPLEDYFPEYDGGPDFERAAAFMRDKFVSLNKSKLTVYPFLTCATDTRNVDMVFTAVQETVLANSLRDSGMF